MTNELSIREFGYIVEAEVEASSLDYCSISTEAWIFLENLAFSNEKENRFISTASYQGKKALQIKNFVGVISTPDGTHIEILPKISELNQSLEETRRLLYKMLCEVEDLPFVETTDASLKLSNKTLPEALITRFLTSLAAVVRQGVRKDYQRIEAEEKFLKGQLLIAQQLRQPAGKHHLFQIAYDVFSENRAENRLIHSALIQVANWSKSAENQKLARELRFAFNEIPKSINYKADFGLWKNTRDMISYKALLPWVRLILNQQSPFTLKDQNLGISFLFPMEKLFEQYVAKKLQKQLQPLGYVVRTQLQQHYLSNDPKAFLLKPDLAIYKDKSLIAILDTKWKLIEQEKLYENGNPDPKSGVSQSDMYQMFAYGHKYLNANGKLFLIYPYYEKFKEGKLFKLSEGLSLNVVPYNLKDDSMTLELQNSTDELKEVA